MSKAFLSHKEAFAAEAEALACALREVIPGVDIFRAEDIEKGGDWREAINAELAAAKCFIMLYTNPELDWSWCFYEAGAFVTTGRKRRRVFCLHPCTVDPPSPLANLQSVKAEQADIEKWIRDFCGVLRRRKPNAKAVQAAAAKIEKLVNATGPIRERKIKPYIWIDPPLPAGIANWNAAKIPEIDFSEAAVSVDEESARQLLFSERPNLTLLPFLRRIACDVPQESGKIEFWIRKFFESLQSAVSNRLLFQEAAYFRHENGSIYRPVVVSYAKDASGGRLRLLVVFASAFGSPLTEAPGLMQRLSDSVRLAVRTRLEVLDPFLGQLARIHQERVLSQRPEDEIARNSPVGRRIVEALDTIWQEAIAHGVRPNEAPPILFEGLAQRKYEDLRRDALRTWNQLRRVAGEEDQQGTGDYPETERLLAEVGRFTEAYLALALPRLQHLLLPAGASTRSRSSPSAVRPKVIRLAALAG